MWLVALNPALYYLAPHVARGCVKPSLLRTALNYSVPFVPFSRPLSLCLLKKYAN